MGFATSTGNTETISEYLAEATGLEATEVGDLTPEVCAEADALIVGAPTWNTGADEQRSGTDWDDWLEDTLPNCDVTGKKVAILDVETKSHTWTTTVMLQVNFTTSLLRLEPQFTVWLQLRDTTTSPQKLRSTVNLLVFYVMRTTKVMSQRVVLRHGLHNRKKKDSPSKLRTEEYRYRIKNKLCL